MYTCYFLYNVEKRENAGYQHLSYFPCFQKLTFAASLKAGLFYDKFTKQSHVLTNHKKNLNTFWRGRQCW